ncbi:hypothetical protein IWQ62_006271, partial [Dispira parvispora]
MEFPPDYTVYQIQAPSFFSRTRHVIQESTRRVVYTKRGPSSFNSRVIFYAPPGSPIYQPLEVAENLVGTCRNRKYLGQSPTRKASPSWTGEESDGDKADGWSVERDTEHIGNDDTKALTASSTAEPWSTLPCRANSPFKVGPRRAYTEIDWAHVHGSFSGRARDDRRKRENDEIDGLAESSDFRVADDYFSTREKEAHRVLHQRLDHGRELSLALSVEKLLGSSIPMTTPSFDAPILWDVSTRRWRKQKCLLFINPRTTLGGWVQVMRDTWTDAKAVRYAFSWNEPLDQHATHDLPSPPLALPRRHSESPRDGRERQYLGNASTGQDYRYGLPPPLGARPLRAASPASSGHTPSSSPTDTTTVEYPWHQDSDNGSPLDAMRSPVNRGAAREYYWKPESLSSQLVCYESSSGLPVARFRRKKLPFRYMGTVTITDALVRSAEFVEFLLFSCL